MNIRNIFRNKIIDQEIVEKLEKIFIILNLTGEKIEYYHNNELEIYHFHFKTSDYYCDLSVSFKLFDKKHLNYIQLKMHHLKGVSYRVVRSNMIGNNFLTPLLELEKLIIGGR